MVAVMLGLIIPSLMFWFIDKHREKLINWTADDVQTQSTSCENCFIDISVLMDDESVKVISLEDYLVSVVLREMPADFEIEALKAQAVVARTYTLRRLNMGGKHDTAVVCTDSSCCQGYYDQAQYISDGGKQELLDKVTSAVNSTVNEVLMYEDALIDATYFSCSGGRTEDALSVWGADIPYLQSTESPGEESATHYVDTVTITTSTFLNNLGLATDAQPLNWIRSIQYTSGGGVDEIQICDKTYKGTEIRQKLGLRSTAFLISIIGDTVTITTKGYGHRVGMSQYGADAMALQGKTYDEILLHYYKDTELVRYRD